MDFKMAQTYIDQNGVERDMATGLPYLAITKRTNPGKTIQSVSSGGGSGGRTFQQAAQQPVQPINLPVLNNEAQVGPGILTPRNPSASPSPSPYLNLQRPDLNIGTNEMLMRVGGAGMRGAQQGGLESMAAMADTYGGIQDQRRTNALAAYNADLAKAKEEQAANKTVADANAISADEMNELRTEIDKYDATLGKFDRGLGYVQQDGLTGPWDGFVGGLLDRVSGDENAAKRLLLQELKVDDVLIRIAQTKGAISNKEMEIFAKPAPNVELDDEATWRKWIEDKRAALLSVRNKLAQRVGQPAAALGASTSTAVPSTVGQSSTIGGVTVTRIK